MSIVCARPRGASRLLLIRHAETAETSRDRCYGSLDVELSPAGHRVAETLATLLAAESIHQLISSPRQRALQTVAPLAAKLDKHVTPDERLREIDFGTFEGRTYDELRESEPELYAQWMEQPTAIRFPGGESYGDLRGRAVEVVGTLPADTTTAVVTHGGVVRALLADALGLPDSHIFRLGVDYASVSIVDRLEDTAIVRCVNVVPLASESVQRSRA